MTALASDLVVKDLAGGDAVLFAGERVQLLERGLRRRGGRLLGRRVGLLTFLSARPAGRGRAGGRQRYSEFVEHRSNLGLAMIDRRFQLTLQLAVALLDAHRDA